MSGRQEAQLQLPSFAIRPDLSALLNHLWEAANILRGPVDAADFKTYIFPLLFFKRISDVYDEESASALVESDGDAQYALFPENHRFQLTHGCHWLDVLGKATNVGQALQTAFRNIETANQRHLYGIFGDAQWTNKERLSDELLKDLLGHFNRIDLSNRSAPSDVLGQAYEYLIKKFADLTNKKAGEFYTPRTVVRLMINILDPHEGETIYDPACGTGGMLLEAVNHVKEAGGHVQTLYGKLYGQEKNLTTEGIARMNLFMHGIEDFQVQRGDTLRSPVFFEGDKLLTFDCVIANPPFSLENWGDETWDKDPYGRNIAGVPPKKSADYAWVQHMIASMAPGTGRMAVVLPNGAMFHSGEEAKIRRKLIEEDLIEAVIALGPNLFYGTGIPAYILVCRRKKPDALRRAVYFIDASELYREYPNQNELEERHAETILGFYRDRRDREGRTRIVPHHEIRANGWSLSVPLYVWNENALNYASKGQCQPPRDLGTMSARLKAAHARALEAEAKLAEVLEAER